MFSSKTDIERFEKKRGSSISSLSRRHLMEMLPNVGCGRICKVDYLSVSGKWLTFSKLIALVLIPVFAGWSFTIYSLVDNISQRQETATAMDVMMKAINLGKIVYKLQKERDTSILYTTKIGPGTRAFLIRDYERTDKAISQMWSWPSNFDTNNKTYFRSKGQFISHINQHRAKLEAGASKSYDEVVFYTEIVDFMMDWMTVNIKESGFGNIWKTLVVFQKITRSMLDTGLERAYGSIFFANGNFLNSDFYNFYFYRIHRVNYYYKTASYYSEMVNPFLHITGEQLNVTIAVNSFRHVIKYSDFSGNYSSALDAQSYFDNITLRIDFLFDIQTLAANKVISLINSTMKDYVVQIIIYSVTSSIVILSCPIIMFLSEALTSHMQAYSVVLLKASNDLDLERSKTDSLLYQMLPKAIAVRLKKSSSLDAEYFKSSTIMFSSIVNFTRMSIEYTSVELVELLNTLYTTIDEKIEQYDVYKVETVNDSYMVVSGVPVPNGMRHSSEIAYLALDIRQMIVHAVYTPIIRIPIQLLFGVCTGSVSAGILGRVMLRYCLFGDTVNIASRMKSYSKPNRIQISESTYKQLSTTGCFKMQSRGKISVKGKGEMNTYWLLGSHGKQELYAPQSSYRLPGEFEEMSNDEESCPTTGNDDIPIPLKPMGSPQVKRRISDGVKTEPAKRKRTPPILE